MIRDRIGADLEEAITFQVCFAKKIYKGLENRFKDNDIVSYLKILNHVELPSRQVGMRSWGVPKLERLCNHYDKDLQIDEKKICALINVDATKREFFSYKVQASTE